MKNGKLSKCSLSFWYILNQYKYKIEKGYISNCALSCSFFFQIRTTGGIWNWQVTFPSFPRFFSLKNPKMLSSFLKVFSISIDPQPHDSISSRKECNITEMKSENVEEFQMRLSDSITATTITEN